MLLSYQRTWCLRFLSAALDDVRVAHFNEPFSDNGGDLGKNDVYHFLGINNFYLDRQGGGEFQYLRGMELAFAPVTRDPAEHASPGYLPGKKDLHDHLIDGFTVDLLVFVNVDGEFFCRAGFNHGILLNYFKIHHRELRGM